MLPCFSTLFEAEKAIENHEVSTNTKFSVCAKDAGFNAKGNVFNTLQLWISNIDDLGTRDDTKNKYTNKFVEFDLKSQKLLFENIKRSNNKQQILFTGTLLSLERNVWIAHGVDRAISTKMKYQTQKIEKVIFKIKHFYQVIKQAQSQILSAFIDETWLFVFFV